jgi:hypothetical protein
MNAPLYNESILTKKSIIKKGIPFLCCAVSEETFEYGNTGEHLSSLL